MTKPEIDHRRCSGCGDCADICPNEVIQIVNGKAVVINAEDCIGCECCIEVCEQEAISLAEVYA